MNTQTKSILKSGLLSGLVFAGLMAAFDYSDGHGFRIWRFLFNASFFGIFMTLLNNYSLKKQAQKENKESK